MSIDFIFTIFAFTVLGFVWYLIATNKNDK